MAAVDWFVYDTPNSCLVNSHHGLRTEVIPWTGESCNVSGLRAGSFRAPQGKIHASVTADTPAVCWRHYGVYQTPCTIRRSDGTINNYSFVPFECDLFQFVCTAQPHWSWTDRDAQGDLDRSTKEGPWRCTNNAENSMNWPQTCFRDVFLFVKSGWYMLVPSLVKVHVHEGFRCLFSCIMHQGDRYICVVLWWS